MKIIKAQFMHQHKDKVVWETPILMDSPTLIQTEDGKFSVIFEMPLFIDRPFIKRWVNSRHSKRITSRVLRFTTNDGAILYTLPKKPLDVSLWIGDDWILFARIRFESTEEEILELAKIFSIEFA